MKIALPEGYQMPANVKEGEPFEAVATITPGGDGSFMLTAIDGVTLAEPEMEEEMEEMAPEEEMADPDIKIPFE